MTRLHRCLLPFFAVFTAACAQDPTTAAPPPREVDTTPPDTTPPMRAPVDVRAVAPAAPGVLTQAALSGPDVVSGSAWRSERDELHAHVMFERTGAPVAWLRARLLDEGGAPVEDAEPIAVQTPARGARGIALLRLPRSEARARVSVIELTLEDAHGGRSMAFAIPVSAFRGVRDGERCVGELGLNECDLGSLCGPSRVCSPPVAPALTRAAAFRAEDARRSGVVLSWSDPNGDVDALEVTAGDRGSASLLPIPERGDASVRDAELRWPMDVFRGSDRAWVRLRDRSGAFSEAVAVSVAGPAVLGSGAPCDPEGVAARCAAGSVCTRFAAASCSQTRCQPDVRECPREIDVTPIDVAPNADGRWTYTETRPAGEVTRPSLCDRDLGAVRAYRFRVPAAGTWRFELRAEAAEWGRLAVRTRCAIGDVDAGMTDGFARDLAPVELTLREPQDVYLLPFTSRGGAAPFSLVVTRAR